MQRAIWALNERMQQISRIDPKYMLIGGLRYLHRTLPRRSDDTFPLQDIEAQRRILDPFLSRDSRRNFVDRWLATALYGVLLACAQTSMERLNDELSILLRSADRFSLQTVGIGWVYHNFGRGRREAALREMLLRTIPPGSWPGGLAALPTIMVSPYLHGGDQELRMLCAGPELWEVVVQALSSRSHVAVLGGLVFLANVSSGAYSNAAPDDIAHALRRLANTQNPLVREKLRLVQLWLPEQA